MEGWRNTFKVKMDWDLDDGLGLALALALEFELSLEGVDVRMRRGGREIGGACQNSSDLS